MLVDIDLNSVLKTDITVNQYLLLKLIENNVSLSKYKNALNIKEEDIEILKEKKLLLKASKYTDSLDELITRTKKNKVDYFTEFYNQYPVYADRPDGTKDYLRLYPNRCRRLYDDIVKLDEDKHNFMLESLKRYVSSKLTTGKQGYMKNMYNWLQSGEYAEISANLTGHENKDVYGTEIE